MVFWTLEGKETHSMNIALQRLYYLYYLLIGISLSLTSCISLKSDYPKITYYRLPQKTVQKGIPAGSAVSSVLSVREILLVKTFTIDTEFDTEQILALNGTSEIQPYNYFRWIAEPRELVTAYVVNHLQASGNFVGGVMTETTSVAPTLQMECRIAEFVARNMGNGAPSAAITLHVVVQRASGANSPVILQKTYSQTSPRTNGEAASIPEAMSEALSKITDAMIVDIIAAAAK